MTIRHRDSKEGTKRTRGRTWQRIRMQVLTDEPLCRACQAQDRVTAAAEVDHIVPIAEGGDHAEYNVQSQTTRFIDWLRQELGAKTVDDAIRAGMSGEPRFYAEEHGHRIGTPATIEPSANSHVFSERELDNMGRGQ